MGTMCQLLVLDPQRQHRADPALINVVVEEGLDWISALGSWELECDELVAMSRRLNTDVALLAFQSASDSFSFRHAQRGKLARDLMFGCKQENAWDSIEGTPQWWEPHVLFDRARLRRHVDSYAKHGIASDCEHLVALMR